MYFPIVVVWCKTDDRRKPIARTIHKGALNLGRVTKSRPLSGAYSSFGTYRFFFWICGVPSYGEPHICIVRITVTLNPMSGLLNDFFPLFITEV